MVELVLNRRQQLAAASPGLVAFGFGLTWFDTPSIVELIVYSVGLGLMLYVAALIAYLAAAYAVARIAGSPTTYERLAPKDDRLTATVLLAVVVWILGQTWVDRKVDTIVACVEDPSLEEVFSPRAPLAEVVSWCAAEYGYDEPDYDY